MVCQNQAIKSFTINWVLPEPPLHNGFTIHCDEWPLKLFRKRASGFYEKSFEAESKFYDYPFGLWIFGSAILKVTGMDIQQLVYILPLILSIIPIRKSDRIEEE